MKQLLIIVLAALMLPVSVHADDEGPAAPESQPTALVTLAIANERKVSETLPAFGSVRPAPGQSVTLAAPRESRVASLAVSSGEAVKKGQLLLTLVPTPASRVAFVQAQSASVYAQTALAHTRSLYQEHLATRDQLAAAQQAANDARAILANATQAGGAGSLALRAPADSVVTAIAVNAGEQVAANSPLLHLALQGALTVRLGIALEQIAKIRVGMPVVLHDVYSSARTLQARVTNVSGMLDANTGLADVFVRIPAHTPGFMPGMYVQGMITLSDTHALAVPRSALLRDGTQAYVFIVEGDIAHRVNVTSLADDGVWVAVKGAIKAGAKVVTLGNYELNEGMKIRTARH